MKVPSKYSVGSEISLLVSESNKYAVKKNLPGDITTEDMKCFIGILLVSGYSWLPRRRMYWENSPDTKNELISSAMTRDRFDFIFRHLHVNDNLDLQDKYTKVRPLVTLLNKKFLEFSPLLIALKHTILIEPVSSFFVPSHPICPCINFKNVSRNQWSNLNYGR